MKSTKKIAVTLALTILSGTAVAAWVEVDRFDDGMRIFVDRTSAVRSGDTAQLAHLVRWGEPQLEPGSPAYLSTVVRTVYNCVSKGERYLGSTSYTGSMGNGAMVIADDDEVASWYSISPSSMEDKLWTIACAAR